MAQKGVVKVLSKYEKRGLFQNISESCDRLLRAPKKDDKDKIYFVGTKNIIERLDKLLRYGAYAGRPDKIKKLHKIRIAAKHLRYTLEHFRMVYGKDTNRFIYLARRIQGFLGDVHDFNVWIEYLKPIRKKGKDTHLVKAAVYLEEEYEKRAKKAYKSFLQIWKESEEENAWQNLVRIVR